MRYFVMSTPTLDVARIQGVKGKDVIEYFDELRDDGVYDEFIVCEALLQAVEREVIQPHVFR